MRRVPERIYIRKYCEVSVKFTDSNTGKYHNATMHNCSVDGMYLELDTSLPPGSEIEVKVKKHLSDAYRAHGYNDYRVKVMWCKEKRMIGKSYYGVGTKRIRFDNNLFGKDNSDDGEWDINLL